MASISSWAAARKSFEDAINPDVTPTSDSSESPVLRRVINELQWATYLRIGYDQARELACPTPGTEQVTTIAKQEPHDAVLYVRLAGATAPQPSERNSGQQRTTSKPADDEGDAAKPAAVFGNAFNGAAQPSQQFALQATQSQQAGGFRSAIGGGAFDQQGASSAFGNSSAFAQQQQTGSGSNGAGGGFRSAVSAGQQGGVSNSGATAPQPSEVNSGQQQTTSKPTNAGDAAKPTASVAASFGAKPPDGAGTANTATTCSPFGALPAKTAEATAIELVPCR